jgi:hypothetical protein
MTSQAFPAAGSPASTNDPFNYPMLGRGDCMSLSTINKMQDSSKTTTNRFATGRVYSNNLATTDIEGKLPF